MNIFISGGCKNGKSFHAQELARDMARVRQVPLYYLATMIPVDEEDRARIRRHLAEREGWGFDTIEQGRNILGCLPRACDARITGAASEETTAAEEAAAEEMTASGETAARELTADREILTMNGAVATGAYQAAGGPRTLSGAPVHPEGVFLLDSVTALLSNEMFLPGGAMDLNAGERLAEELVDFAKRTGNTVFVSDYIYSDARFFDCYTETYRRGLAMIDRALARVCDQVIEVTFGMKYLYK